MAILNLSNICENMFVVITLERMNFKYGKLQARLVPNSKIYYHIQYDKVFAFLILNTELYLLKLNKLFWYYSTIMTKCHDEMGIFVREGFLFSRGYIRWKLWK